MDGPELQTGKAQPGKRDDKYGSEQYESGSSDEARPCFYPARVSAQQHAIEHAAYAEAGQKQAQQSGTFEVITVINEGGDEVRDSVCDKTHDEKFYPVGTDLSKLAAEVDQEAKKAKPGYSKDEAVGMCGAEHASEKTNAQDDEHAQGVECEVFEIILLALPTHELDKG